MPVARCIFLDWAVGRTCEARGVSAPVTGRDTAVLRLGASVPAVTIHILCTTHVQRRVTADALFYRATLRHCAVSVSVTSRSSIEMEERVIKSWFFAWGLPVLYCVITCSKKFGYLQKGYFILKLPHNLDLRHTSSRPCCQQNSSTVELVDDTCDGRRVVAGHT